MKVTKSVLYINLQESFSIKKELKLLYANILYGIK